MKTKRTTLIDEFVTRWKVHYPGETFVVKGGEHGAGLKRLEKALGRDEVLARMDRYFCSPDPWYRQRRHDLGVFISLINQLGGHSAPAVTQAEMLHEMRTRLVARGIREAMYLERFGATAALANGCVTLTTAYRDALEPHHAALEAAVVALVPGVKLEIRDAP